MPRGSSPSIQINIRAGRFPPAESNGVRYLTIPVKAKTGDAASVFGAETATASSGKAAHRVSDRL